MNEPWSGGETVAWFALAVGIAALMLFVWHDLSSRASTLRRQKPPEPFSDHAIRRMMSESSEASDDGRTAPDAADDPSEARIAAAAAAMYALHLVIQAERATAREGQRPPPASWEELARAALAAADREEAW